jgi:hypothetical protein
MRMDGRRVRLLVLLFTCLHVKICTPAGGLRGGSSWVSSLISRISSRRVEGNEPKDGDAVVRRTVLDQKANSWKHVPLHVWPRDAHNFNVVNTVPEAVEDCLDQRNRRVYVGSGKHSWDGDRLVVGGWRADEKQPAEGTYPSPGAMHSLNVTGEPQARMWGMWVLEPRASGSFEGVMLAFKTDFEDRATVEVWDGPWLFGSCDIRSTGGTAIVAGRRSKIACTKCGIGGLEAGERDEFGDWILSEEHASGAPGRASYGIQMGDIAAIVLEQCMVEFTGLKGAGVATGGKSTLEADGCEFYANSVGVYIDDNSTVQVWDSACVLLMYVYSTCT